MTEGRQRPRVGADEIVPIVLPLARGDGGVGVYFEGAYRMPVEAQLALHHRARDAAVAVPAITLLAGFALYHLFPWRERNLRLKKRR